VVVAAPDRPHILCTLGHAVIEAVTIRGLQHFVVREGVLFGPPGQALPRGGKTEVTIHDREGNSFTCSARCRASDRFRRQIGVAVALDKVLIHWGHNVSDAFVEEEGDGGNDLSLRA
jgi:hypothetical protein